MNFIAALRHDSVDAPWIPKRQIDGEAFLNYVKTQLVKTLKPGDIVVREISARIMGATWSRLLEQGELDPDADAAGLASVASAVMHSLAVRARAGESRRALDKLSKSALDLICGKQAKRIW